MKLVIQCAFVAGVVFVVGATLHPWDRVGYVIGIVVATVVYLTLTVPTDTGEATW